MRLILGRLKYPRLPLVDYFEMASNINDGPRWPYPTGVIVAHAEFLCAADPLGMLKKDPSEPTRRCPQSRPL